MKSFKNKNEKNFNSDITVKGTLWHHLEVVRV